MRGLRAKAGGTAMGAWSWWGGVLGLTLLAQAAVYASRPASTYRALELGASGTSLGLVVASFAVLPLLCAVPLGWWMDRWGERPFLLVGTVLIATMPFALNMVGGLPTLALALGILGLGHLLVAMAVQTLIAKRSAGGRAATGFGYFTVVVSLGQLLGSMLLGMLAGGPTTATATGGVGPAGSSTEAHPDPTPVFIAAGALATIASLIAVTSTGGLRRVPRCAPPPAASGYDGIVRSGRHVLGLVNMPQAMWVSLSVLAVLDLLVAYLPAYAQSVGMSVQTVGFLLAALTAASLAARACMAVVTRWLQLKTLLVTCTGVPALALVMFPLLHDTPPLPYVLMVAAGLGLGLGQPLTLAWVAETAPTRVKGTAIAIRLAGNRAGQVAIPAAVGVLTGVTGAGAIFVAMTLLLGASTWAALKGPGSFDDKERP